MKREPVDVEVDLARAVVRLVLDRRSVTASTSAAMRRPYSSSTFTTDGPGLLEQPPLGREVGVHRLVEVEVVLREVGEHAAGEADSGHPAELERVRGDLHRARRGRRRRACA